MALTFDRDLNDVLVFLQVVQSGSFTAAGRELGVPTSTISRRVARLEAQLGVQLLKRSTRKLSLTEAGQLYFERGTASLSGLEEAEAVLADAQARPRGRVRLAAPLDHQVSMRLVLPFLEAHPEVHVDLELTDRAVNLIEEGYDAVICVGTLVHLSVVAHRLFDSPFVLVASPAYLDAHGRPEQVEDLEQHQCIVFGGSSASTTWTFPKPDQPDERIALSVSGRLSVNHLGAARDATVAGLGVAALPRLACARELGSGELEVVLPGVAPPPVPIWITHAGGRYLPPAIRGFVDHVRAHFAEFARAQLGD